MKKIVLIFALIVFSVQLSVAKDSPSLRAAIKYADVARSYMLDGNGEKALEQVEKGIAYDSSLSDLHYIKAMALSMCGEKKAQSIKLCETALELDNFRTINPDANRTMLADYYSDTNRATFALKVLEKSPILFTSDSEFIKAKSYYRMKRKLDARKIVDAARKVFPNDGRFATLFFQFEDPADTDSVLAKKLLAVLDKWEKNYPEVLVYASRFLEVGDKQQMLKDFAKKNKPTVDWIIEALSCELITDEEAVPLFEIAMGKNFVMEDRVTRFSKTLKSEECVEQFINFLNSFTGTIAKDYSDDTLPDTFIGYELGQISFVMYSRFQDDVLNWENQFKDKKPFLLKYYDGDADFEYYKFPAVEKVSFYTGEIIYPVPNEIKIATFEIVPLFTGFDMDFNSIELVSLNKENYSYDEILKNISAFETPTKERPNGRIKFAMLNGQILNAYYFTNGTPFAFTAFENGIPLFRNVDSNNDQKFEVTEYYVRDIEKFSLFQTEKERDVLESTLFGTIRAPKGLYLSKVTCDLDGDFISDYFEVYKEDGSKTCGWDTDCDGSYDIGFVQKIENDSERSGKINSVFYTHPISKKVFTATIVDGNPVEMISDGKKISVTKVDSLSFYWIGTVDTVDNAKKIIDELEKSKGSCVCVIDGKRFFASKIGSIYFGEIINEL